jgi:hypothetical protein
MQDAPAIISTNIHYIPLYCVLICSRTIASVLHYHSTLYLVFGMMTLPNTLSVLAHTAG